MIIVSNFRGRTFRYWAIRATDVQGIGSSPRGEMANICPDFNLSNRNLPRYNTNKLIHFNYLHNQAFSTHFNVIPCISQLFKVTVKNNKYQKGIKPLPNFHGLRQIKSGPSEACSDL